MSSSQGRQQRTRIRTAVNLPMPCGNALRWVTTGARKTSLAPWLTWHVQKPVSSPESVGMSTAALPPDGRYIDLRRTLLSQPRRFCGSAAVGPTLLHSGVRNGQHGAGDQLGIVNRRIV